MKGEAVPKTALAVAGAALVAGCVTESRQLAQAKFASSEKCAPRRVTGYQLTSYGANNPAAQNHPREDVLHPVIGLSFHEGQAPFRGQPIVPLPTAEPSSQARGIPPAGWVNPT